MGRKKIMIVNPIALFPRVMASQDRVINMVKRLSRDHSVDITTCVRNDEEVRESEKELKNICRRFYPVHSLNPSGSFFSRKYHGLRSFVYFYLLGQPARYYYWGNDELIKRISGVILKNRYDIVQVEYWYQSGLFRRLGPGILKVIDTHDILYEKERLRVQDRFGAKTPYFISRGLRVCERMERASLKSADLLISISKSDYDTIRSIAPATDNMLTYPGQDISYFEKYKGGCAGDMVLFYGGMNSGQNIKAFFRLWNNILPLIKMRMPGVKVAVVGSNPPASIRNLHNGKNVIVSGYVKDVREYLSRGAVMILPLEIAGGFRCRVIDAMSMGIPVIGTHNALDSVEMASGTHGYITDDDKEMARCAVELLQDRVLRDKMGRECMNFVSEKYSIEATYGKLSKYYETL